MKSPDELVQENLNLVYHTARTMAKRLSTVVSHEELVGAGTLGLIMASQGYDASRGLAFSTYAVPRIRGAILDELRRDDHVPRSVRQKVRTMSMARDAVERTFLRQSTPSEIAEVLDIPVEQMYTWRADVEGAVRMPIERPRRETDDGLSSKTGLVLVDAKETPDISTEWEDMVTAVRKHILQLKEQERTVLGLYYFEELSVKEIASILNLHTSRITQIKIKALQRLRESMAECIY